MNSKSPSTLNDDNSAKDPEQGASINLLLLLVGVGIMVIGSVYPIVFTNAAGKADHGIASALFWAMAAALVRGVGFIPRHLVFRWLFSGWMCAACIALAVMLRFF